MIRSRVGLSARCMFVDEFLSEMQDPDGIAHKDPEAGKYAAVIVDVAQFLTEKEVDQLSDIVDSYNTPVLCYGLRTDFTGHLFEGARRLLELADVVEEVPTVCWRGKRAQFNARIKNGKIEKEEE